jgi:hypothetical protein
VSIRRLRNLIGAVAMADIAVTAIQSIDIKVSRAIPRGEQEDLWKDLDQLDVDLGDFRRG